MSIQNDRWIRDQAIRIPNDRRLRRGAGGLPAPSPVIFRCMDIDLRITGKLKMLTQAKSTLDQSSGV